MIPEQQNISVGAQEQNFATGEKHSAVVTTGEQNKNLQLSLQNSRSLPQN